MRVLGEGADLTYRIRKSVSPILEKFPNLSQKVSPRPFREEADSGPYGAKYEEFFLSPDCGDGEMGTTRWR